MCIRDRERRVRCRLSAAMPGVLHRGLEWRESGANPTDQAERVPWKLEETCSWPPPPSMLNDRQDLEAIPGTGRLTVFRSPGLTFSFSA